MGFNYFYSILWASKDQTWSCKGLQIKAVNTRYWIRVVKHVQHVERKCLSVRPSSRQRHNRLCRNCEYRHEDITKLLVFFSMSMFMLLCCYSVIMSECPHYKHKGVTSFLCRYVDVVISLVWTRLNIIGVVTECQRLTGAMRCYVFTSHLKDLMGVYIFAFLVLNI